MAQISGNTCSILTIFPMGVLCNPTNATSLVTSDGSISLNISGGTGPYSINWVQGNVELASTQTINNLSPGVYEATVTDFYGDFQVTIDCEVGTNFDIVGKFENCDNPADIVYVSGTTGLTLPRVVRFISLPEDCYTYLGQVSSTGQTLSALTIDSTYRNCQTCEDTRPQPTPTPTPQPTTLCLTDNFSVSYEFTLSGTDVNGNYVWENVADSLIMSFNTGQSRWEIQNWANVGSGQMIQITNSVVPLGDWVNAGVGSRLEWSVYSGPCSSIELSLSVNVSPETCPGDQDGLAIITGSGGVPPYQYRIVNFGTYPAYSYSTTFVGLTAGNYVAQIRDYNSNVASVSFTVGNNCVSPQVSPTPTPTPPQCIEYYAERRIDPYGPTGSYVALIDYIDCNGVPQQATLASNSSTTFCSITTPVVVYDPLGEVSLGPTGLCP